MLRDITGPLLTFINDMTFILYIIVYRVETFTLSSTYLLKILNGLVNTMTYSNLTANTHTFPVITK